jgi:type I secretion membrane fusion protein, HlyD family
MTVTSQNARDDWKRPAFRSIVVLALTFGVAGTWSALARLDSAVVAPGRLVVEGERKVVQHLEGGIVAEILVAPDSHVEAGDVLLRIDPTQARAGAEIGAGQLASARAEEARLVAEIDGLPVIAFPDGIPAGVRAGQESALAEARANRAGEVSILEAQAAQLETQAEGMAGQRAAAVAQLESFRDELERIRPLLDKQLVPANKGRDLERQITELEARVAAYDNETERLAVAVAETRLKIEAVDAKARDAASARLVAVRAALTELEGRSAVSDDMLARSEIRAPRSGTVVGVQVHTVGQVVSPGQVLLEIVPDDDRLMVSSRMSPLDVTHVHPGLEAEVRLPSFKGSETPVAFGTVRAVSADVMVDEATGQSYYELSVAVGDDGFPAELRDAMVPGMPAEVVVSTGERTVLAYLMQPLGDAMRLGMRER